MLKAGSIDWEFQEAENNVFMIILPSLACELLFKSIPTVTNDEFYLGSIV